MRRFNRNGIRHSNRDLTRALHSMKENNDSEDLTQIHPLVLVTLLLAGLYLISKMLKKGVKLPGIPEVTSKQELPGE